MVFFYNRLRISRGALRGALAGMACWAVSLFLEALRHSFKLAGDRIYDLEALIEKELQMVGAILLFGSIVFYTLDVALDFSAERRARLAQASRFLTRQAAGGLAAMLVLLVALAGAAYLYARKEAASNAPLPRLMAAALEDSAEVDQVDDTLLEPPVASGPAPFTIWFEDLDAPMALAQPDAEALLRSVRAALLERQASLRDLPPAVAADRQPRIVFVSVSDRERRARVAIGAAAGLRPAVELAVAQLLEGPPLAAKSPWLRLDVVQGVQPPLKLEPTTSLGAPNGLEGIAFGRERGIAFLAQEVLAANLVTNDGRLPISAVNSYLRKRWLSPGQPPTLTARDNTVTHFTTASFFHDGERVFPLYRGHREKPDLSPAGLLDSARAGGAYLARSVDPEGRFAYSYSPDRNRVAPTYNMVRHAGTVYSMFELYQVTRDPALRTAADRALGHLLQSTAPYGEPDEQMTMVVDDDKIKLGGVALTVVALVQHLEATQDRQHLPLLQSLGRYIVRQQRESGEFISQRFAETGEARDDFESQYYPGEAILALVRLHRVDPRPVWLDTAQKGAGYLINVRDKGKPVSSLIHDHWLLYALNELHRARPEPIYLEHAMRIVEAIQAGQNRKVAYPDYFGSFYDPPRSTPAATRAEGLAAAHDLARDFVSAERAASILETLRSTVGYQLHTQFQPESVMYFDIPQRSLGGFHRALDHYEIRIDYVQHNISALLGLRRILEKTSGQRAPERAK